MFICIILLPLILSSLDSWENAGRPAEVAFKLIPWEFQLCWCDLSHIQIAKYKSTLYNFTHTPLFLPISNLFNLLYIYSIQNHSSNGLSNSPHLNRQKLQTWNCVVSFSLKGRGLRQNIFFSDLLHFWSIKNTAKFKGNAVFLIFNQIFIVNIVKHYYNNHSSSKILSFFENFFKIFWCPIVLPCLTVRTQLSSAQLSRAPIIHPSLMQTKIPQDPPRQNQQASRPTIPDLICFVSLPNNNCTHQTPNSDQ